jgi:hypothetical protein
MVRCKVGEGQKAEAVCLLLMGVLKLRLVLATPKLASFKKRQEGEYVYSMKAHFLLVGTCSTNTSTQYSFLNSRMNRGSHNSLATPRSLQQRISALLLQASVAVGIPEGSKYSCSPRAIPTSLPERGLSLISQKIRFRSPPETNQSILPADYLWTDIRFATRSQAPTTRTESLVQNPAILDFWEVNHAVLRLTFRQRQRQS